MRRYSIPVGLILLIILLVILLGCDNATQPAPAPAPPVEPEVELYEPDPYDIDDNSGNMGSAAPDFPHSPQRLDDTKVDVDAGPVDVTVE